MLIRDGVVVGELTLRAAPSRGLHPLHAAPTTVETVQLQRSDRVLFYTDGLVEGGRRGGSRFGVERLADLLARAHSEGLGCAETIRQLGHKVLEHADYRVKRRCHHAARRVARRSDRRTRRCERCAGAAEGRLMTSVSAN